MLEDLDDRYVTAIVTLQHVMEALLALHCEDVLTKLQHKPDVLFLKKAMRRASGCSEGIVADTVAQVSVWKDALSAYTESVEAAAVHKQKLMRLRAWLDKSRVNEELSVLLQNVKELAFLKSEFDVKDLRVFLQDTKTIAVAWWESASKDIEKETYGEDSGLLREILQECDLLWPEDGCFRSGIVFLEKTLATKKGAKKMEQFVMSLAALGQAFAAKEAYQPALVADVKTHAQACRGIPLAEAKCHECSLVFDLLCEESLDRVDKREEGEEVLSVLSELQTWMSPLQQSNLQTLQCIFAVERDLARFQGSVAEKQGMGKDEGKDDLCQLMRSQETIAKRLASDKEKWGGKELSRSCKRGHEILDAVKQFMCEDTEEALNGQVATCKALLAQSDLRGARWEACLDASAGWEEALKHCKGTLSKIKAEELEVSHKSLYEARRLGLARGFVGWTQGRNLQS